MNLNKLYLFSKNTDAFSAQRGYNYQTLKTLETWINNFLNDNKEDIYCEFEEDIFQRDLVKQTLTFRQIKLYSSNFSFSSEEIKKSISHFFTLHIKSNYNDFSKEYIFETNTCIAKKYLNNDADLLREWFENQDTLDNQELIKYASKVKEIVTEYIEEQKKDLKDKDGISEAIEAFEELDNSFWEEFTKMIKWNFIGTSPDQEFTSTRANIEKLILELPYDSVKNNSLQAFGVLLDTVFTKVTEKDEEKRKLTYVQLEQSLLNIGNEEDKWYLRRYEYYKTIDLISEFRIGEFYEVLDLVNYCRRKKYLHKHKDVWNPSLAYYARNSEIDKLFRRKAIYEIVFLNNEFYEVDFDNLDNRKRPEGNLFGFEDDIHYYFNEINAFKTAAELEEAHIIISLLFVVIKNDKVNISYDELRKWFVEVYRKINQKLSSEKDINEKCNLLEQKGIFLLGINRLRKNSNTEFLQYFDEVLKLVADAPLFKVSQFSDRIEKYIKMQLYIDSQDEMGIIEKLEDFSEKLFPLVETREGKVRLAQSQVKRGYSYLQTSEPKNLLKALKYFHEAKDNYLQEDTIEGFILALLNIAQLYISIGMHFAAKNYALAAFRMSMNKELLKRIENSLSMLAYADYRQGSWFNALNIYGRYIQIRLEENFDISDIEGDRKATVNIAFMLHTMSRSSYQFTYLIDNYIGYLDYFGEKIVKPIQEKIGLELQSDQDHKNAIENHIDDLPLNDIGKERLISFYALGSLWQIKFINTHKALSVAEEYISTIQIVLAEIALSDVDFHLLKSTIIIELILSATYLPPEQLPSNEEIKWKVPVYYSDVVGAEQINQHSAFNLVSLHLILDHISLLKSEEFEKLFQEFFKKAKLDTKQIALNLYQKIHRDIYNEEDFDALQSFSFEKEKFDLKLPKENSVMIWDDSLSLKYSRTFSIEAIKNRLENTYKSTYLTLVELKKNSNFSIWVSNLRNQGWKDWQILVNMQSFMVNYKVQLIKHEEFNTQQEYVENFQKIYYEYLCMDEKDCYVQFPLRAFETKEFTDQFDVGSLSLLNTYSLENKLMTPNFKAIKEFLNIKFNLQADDYVENNPLKNV